MKNQSNDHLIFNNITTGNCSDSYEFMMMAPDFCYYPSSCGLNGTDYGFNVWDDSSSCNNDLINCWDGYRDVYMYAGQSNDYTSLIMDYFSNPFRLWGFPYLDTILIRSNNTGLYYFEMYFYNNSNNYPDCYLKNWLNFVNSSVTNFTLEKAFTVPYGKDYQWACSAYDTAGNYNITGNWTFNVTMPVTPSGGGGGSSILMPMRKAMDAAEVPWWIMLTEVFILIIAFLV